jgi:hypothetical protein
MKTFAKMLLGLSFLILNIEELFDDLFRIFFKNQTVGLK